MRYPISRRGMRRTAVAAGLATLLAAFGFRWWTGRATHPGRDGAEPSLQTSAVIRTMPPAPETGFVGSAACAECHADVSDEYQTHSMAHSLAPVLEAAPLEQYGPGSEFSPTERVYYRAEKVGQRVFHHERRVSADGQDIYDQGVEVHFSVGSGTRGRSYLINRDGRLVLSPMTWYSNAARWDLAPGYDPSSHPRFERRASDACLSCHAGRVAPLPDEQNRFDEAPFVEANIGCERCHGPGQRHVQFHRAGTGSTAVDPIVNPVKLSPVLRDAVCNQCHLQGEWRVLRYGRGEYDFRPGKPLSDVWTAFLKTAEAGPDGDIAIVSQVEQMLSSACYQQSQGALGCVSCHDPHSRPPPTDRSAFYRSRCYSCHAEGGASPCAVPEERRRAPAQEDSCIACHMPALSASDVPHTAQTDHRILRFPAATSGHASDAPSVPSDTFAVRIFSEPGFEADPVELQRAEGIFLALQADLRQQPATAREALELLVPVVNANPRDLEALAAAGRAWALLGNRSEAQRLWLAVLSIQPRHEDALALIAVLNHQSGDLARARDAYFRLIEVNPTRAEYLGRTAHVLGQLGDFDAAIPLAEKALELNPSLVQTHGWLAEVYRMKGDLDQYREHMRLMERFRTQPDSPD